MRIIMLCGPPGAGKTTYVANNRGPDDCQVDIDLIPKDWPQRERRSARKILLQRAQASGSPGVCWFNTAAPTRKQRDYWRSFVRIERTIVLLPPMSVAMERARARDGALLYDIEGWYKKYDPADFEADTCVIKG